MSALFEQYFQNVVVDKIIKAISEQFQGIRDELERLKKNEPNYTNICNELEGLKIKVSDFRQEVSENIQNKINELIMKDDKKAGKVKKQIPVETSPKKKTIVKKTTTK